MNKYKPKLMLDNFKFYWAEKSEQLRMSSKFSLIKTYMYSYNQTESGHLS